MCLLPVLGAGQRLSGNDRAGGSRNSRVGLFRWTESASRLRAFSRGLPIDAFGHARREGEIRQRRRVYMANGLPHSPCARFCLGRMRQNGAFFGATATQRIARGRPGMTVFAGRRRRTVPLRTGPGGISPGELDRLLGRHRGRGIRVGFAPPAPSPRIMCRPWNIQWLLGFTPLHARIASRPVMRAQPTIRPGDPT